MTDLRAQLQTTLGTAYTIDRELGGGGMSRVFVAEDAALRRQVVVKVLPPEMAGAMSVERFRREIQVAARLQHPHVVPLLSAGHSGDLLYFMMPFVSGESLRSRLVRGELPIPEAVRLLRGVADALAYAHKHGVVHRDIKPENILLSEGHALVTDFGVAKAVSAATGTASGGTSIGMAVGTPAYMAPEQATADPSADHRVDIYAFGVLAYELLVGERPFRGRTALELVAAQVTQTPDVVSKRRHSVPEQLSALIMCCLEKRPADRPQSAEEIVHVLDTALTPGGHVPGYATFSAGARARVRPWLPIGIAAVLGITLLAAGFVWRARRDVATDERLVAVVPFRVAGADPSLHYLREGMIDLLAAKLTGSTRVADPRSVLAAWRAAGGSESSDLDRPAALRLATRLGAREVLLGDVTGGSGTVVLRASLVPVDGGAARDATIEGSQDSIPALVDRLAVQLLALRAGEDMNALGGLTGIPLPAIRDYLEGQKLGRRGEYKAAYDRFRAAVRADSNFAAAWYGVLDMDGWSGAFAPTDTASRALARLRDRLTPATRAIVDARIGPNYPVSPTNAETRRLAERATEIAPDNPYVWQYMGDVFFHWAPAEGVEDSEQRAIAAFERALTLDPSFAAALEHLPQLYYEQGDTIAMRRTLDAAMANDSSGLGVNQFLAEVALGDARRGAQWRARVRRDPAPLGDMSVLAEELGLSRRLVDSVVVRLVAGAITDAERFGWAIVQTFFAHSRGQPNRAVRIVRATPNLLGERSTAADIVLDGLFADADSSLAEEARRALDAGVASDSVLDNGLIWFAAAIHDLDQGKPETARRVVSRFRAAAPSACSPRVPTLCADYALVIDALLASTESRPDARARLAQLDSMLREGPVRFGLLLQAGNLVAARLWEQAGDAPRALAAVRRRVRFSGWARFHATYIGEEGRLAAVTGDRDGAVRAYRHYLTLREDAEPLFQAHIATVRRELARLEGEPGR